MKPRLKVLGAFKDIHSCRPDWLSRSPGRVNLIGEHTDYNDGLVLPLAIDYAIWVAFKPRADKRVRLFALDLDQELEFELGLQDSGLGGWKDYITGVAWSLAEEGLPLNGWEGVVSGDVPRGAGLSSSAAIELAVAQAFSLVSGWDWDPASMARICQRAENDWVGVQTGIMDQMISACGQPGAALKIDCRSLETTPVLLPEDTGVVILDSDTRRGLVDSAYNERREQCEAVASAFGVPALRDLSLADLEGGKDQLHPLLYRRARHVISGNQRVLDAVEACRANDPSRLGSLMNASHISMRDDFEISRPEMDQLVEIAQTFPGCFGARQTGGGFGGCAVALVERDAAENFQVEVAERYARITGLNPRTYLTRAVQGTSFEDLREDARS